MDPPEASGGHRPEIKEITKELTKMRTREEEIKEREQNQGNHSTHINAETKNRSRNISDHADAIS